MPPKQPLIHKTQPPRRPLRRPIQIIALPLIPPKPQRLKHVPRKQVLHLGRRGRALQRGGVQDGAYFDDAVGEIHVHEGDGAHGLGGRL